jgi:hypothetical protein
VEWDMLSSLHWALSRRGGSEISTGGGGPVQHIMVRTTDFIQANLQTTLLLLQISLPEE